MYRALWADDGPIACELLAYSDNETDLLPIRLQLGRSLVLASRVREGDTVLGTVTDFGEEPGDRGHLHARAQRARRDPRTGLKRRGHQGHLGRRRRPR